MKSQIAQLRVDQVSQASVEDARISELVRLINQNIKPLKELTAGDVNIRVMYVVSDEVNSYGGMFGYDEMNQLTNLLVNSPVLIGHRKDNLPVARNFHAEIETNDTRRWVKSYFYWLKDADGSKTLQKNIDGGLYKECSIGFTFNFPECTICAEDIRRCPHEPFAEYKTGRSKQRCFYFYKEIDKVLETSLVYRGAVPDTSISDRLFSDSIHVAASYTQKDAVGQDIKPNNWYLAAPYYEGLEVIFSKDSDNIFVQFINDDNININLIANKVKTIPFCLERQPAVVVGYRGKERCSKEELTAYLSGEKSQVSRIEIKLLPNDKLFKYYRIINDMPGVSLLNTRCLKGVDIESVKTTLMTKEGLRLYPLEKNLGSFQETQTEERTFEMYFTSEKKCMLALHGPDKMLFQLKGFSGKPIKKGQRFLALAVENELANNQNRTVVVAGTGKKISDDDTFDLVVSKYPQERFRLQKIKLNNQYQYLFQLVS